MHAGLGATALLTHGGSGWPIAQSKMAVILRLPASSAITDSNRRKRS